MARPRLLPFLLALLVLAAPASAATWFVDNAHANGDGSEASPFASLAAAESASGPDDTIAVAAGNEPYRGGFRLKPGQTLRAAGDARPVIQGEVVVTGSATIRGLALAGTLRSDARSGDVHVENTTIETTDAAAVELRNVNLDVVLARVTVAGAFDRGIVLENTTGRFAVAGGAITGARQRAVELRGAANVTLQNLTITGAAKGNSGAASDCSELTAGKTLSCNAAIAGHDLQNLVLDTVTVEGSGDELHEHGLVFRNLTGEIRVTGCTIRRPASRALSIVNTAGDARITLENNRVSDVVQPLGMQGVFLNAADKARVLLTARGNTFTNVYSAAIYASAEDHSQLDATITANTFQAAGGAINVIGDRGGEVKFTLSDNSAKDSTAVAINVASGAASVGTTMSGVIANNKLSGVKCGGCTGIMVKASGTSVIAANVTGNEIDHTDGSAVWVHGDKRARLDVGVQSNLIRDPLVATYPAVRVQAGALPDDLAVVCARIGGSGVAANRISGSWDPRGAIHLFNRTQSTLRLPGLNGKGADAAAAYMAGRNGGALTRVVLAAEPRADAIAGGNECAVPEIR